MNDQAIRDRCRESGYLYPTIEDFIESAPELAAQGLLDQGFRLGWRMARAPASLLGPDVDDGDREEWEGTP